jgi:hypothetical protein
MIRSEPARQGSRTWLLPAIAAVSAALALALGALTVSELVDVVRPEASHSASFARSSQTRHADVRTSAGIVDVLVNLYLLGAALFVARAAAGRVRRSPRPNAAPLQPAALLMTGGYVWFSSGLMLLLWLKLLAYGTLRALDSYPDPLRELLVLVASLLLAGIATLLALHPNANPPPVAPQDAHLP